jgi:hypothetical protein
MVCFFLVFLEKEKIIHLARNLAICIGQSLIWPVRAEDVLKNDVPPFIEASICE